eukprot:119759-Prymnesium_polylepis.1
MESESTNAAAADPPTRRRPALSGRRRGHKGSGARPNRWLLKNTDTFAGFAHAMNTYLAGVTLAHTRGVGLIHRPQPMAHSLGYTFEDFFSMDPRGVVPPVYAPTLDADNATMLVDGRPMRLDVIAGGATTNATRLADRIGNAAPDTVVWLRKGRSSVPPDGCPRCGCHTEVRYAAVWLRERFWRATFAWAANREAIAASSTAAATRHNAQQRKKKDSLSPSRAASPSMLQLTSRADGAARVAVHVRRGDVYYLGPKTGRPHPHWVDTSVVLEILRGVRDALGGPLAPPSVELDVFTEAGWLANDTAALRELAPAARVHTASDPHSTVDALIAMARADLLVMGSSGFSLWAGILSCGVKVGAPLHEGLPMRHVGYDATITTRTEPFERTALPQLRQ